MVEETKVEVATPKALKKALEHEKTPELAAKLAEEAVERDSWAAEVSQLAVPKLVEQVALNAWKEQEGSRVCLHLRPASATSIPPARSKSWLKRWGCCTVRRLN
ncbi:DNA polymerase III subunits gamma and tau [Klebsiella pneumoniae]|nr:DNA polymerase III subunits gamma and tau [Klebsiella pneumoniae]